MYKVWAPQKHFAITIESAFHKAPTTLLLLSSADPLILVLGDLTVTTTHPAPCSQLLFMTAQKAHFPLIVAQNSTSDVLTMERSQT